MSKVQMLRSVVHQRLTAAAEEIFGLFERTIAEYEEELSSSKEENERQRKLLDAVFNPEVRIQRTDVQHLLVVKEEVPPEQQDWSSSLDLEDPEPPHIKEEQDDPEPSHIKDEQEELWTSQEGEQLQILVEADIKFSLTPVKSEYDEEEAQSSQLHQKQTEQMETEADREDCGGPEPDRKSDPDRHPGADMDEKTGDSSEPEPEAKHSDDWKESRESQSGLNYLNNDEVPVSDLRCTTGEKLFGTGEILKKHMRINTGKQPFSCSVCKKSFARSRHLQVHMRVHTGEKPYSCSVCEKAFAQSHHLQNHMRVHTGEKPYSCHVCNKYFSYIGTLTIHMRSHTGVKPYSCSVCKKAFPRNDSLQKHMRSHTGEKPYSCSVCKKAFPRNDTLQTHMRVHTGEKPYRCSVCYKYFSHSGTLTDHMRIHTREKPHSCSLSGKRFQRREGGIGGARTLT